MATTTNYGWTTPDDTALVKDGASAIRSLGSAIDSTLKTQIDAQIPDSIIDAKGDLIVGTADNTPARLASSGVNGDALQVDTSTASGLKWASLSADKTLASIASGSLTSGTTLTVSSLTADTMFLFFYGINSGTSGAVNLTFNGDTSSIYNYGGFRSDTQANGNSSASAANFPLAVGSSLLTGNTTNRFMIMITNAKKAGFTTVQSIAHFNTTGPTALLSSLSGFYKSAAQVTSLTVTFAGTLSAGTYELIGG